ncbi:MAG: DUF1441 family protein [Proteobacteria bacterium]|nr:DUF1441 family protein [Pseudomonadota bacterium]
MMSKIDRSTAGAARETNKAGLAEFFGVSLPTIDAWIRKGCPAVQRGNLSTPWVFDLLAVAEWRFSGSADNDGELDPERLSPADRKAWYEGESRRRDLRERDRELIPAAEVEQAAATAVAAIDESMRHLQSRLVTMIDLPPDAITLVGGLLRSELEALEEQLSSITSRPASGG